MCVNCLRDILQLGGSAVDGAIAALLCTAVINPQSTGIGGGAIFTVMDHTGKAATFTQPISEGGLPTEIMILFYSRWENKVDYVSSSPR